MVHRQGGAGRIAGQEGAGPEPARTAAGRPSSPPRRRDAPLDERFVAHLRETGLIQPGQTVVVAASGGADSTVLLHLLVRLREPWGLRLVAAHFDHAMRPSSVADADWVAGLCRAWEVPLERDRAQDVPRNEEEARAARYRFLLEIADRHGADRVATAHHADDQAETVLFRIARGTGLRGLAGIPARRGPFVRPLLPFWRREILDYARRAGIGYRLDPTNLSVEPARNRLRHEILPRLEEIAPGAARAIVRLAEHARDAEEAWDSVLDRLEPELVLESREDCIALARPLLLSYHPQLRVRMLRRLLRRLGSQPDRAGTRAAIEFITCGASGSHLRVAGGVRLEREFDRILLRRAPRESPPDRTLIISGPGQGMGDVTLGDGRYRVRWTVGEGADEPGTVAFRLSDLRFPLHLRAWRPGDRIRLPYGTKKLKKLFAERRVGRAERARIPVLADSEGRILWVAGIARASLPEAEPGRPHLRIAVTNAGAEPDAGWWGGVAREGRSGGRLR